MIEINEAFAAQVLACLKGFGVPLDDKRVNPNGGAIAVGHPLGASGARLALTAARQLQRTGGRYALVSMCIGVGQGIAVVLERRVNCHLGLAQSARAGIQGQNSNDQFEVAGSRILRCREIPG